MKTKFRTTTIFFALGLLGVTGTIPAFILFKDYNNLGQLQTGVIVFLVLFSLLFIAGVFGLIWFTIQVDIDLTSDRISFNYPFRFQKFQYKTSEIIGFRYKYLRAKVDYKSIKFRTTDGKTFSISDFETSNLRDFENFSLNHFDLRAGKEFNELTEKQKKTERQISKEFDHEQGKDIRFYLAILSLALIVIILVLSYKVISGQVTKVKGVSITIGILLTIAILTIRRFLKINERVKNGA